MAGKIVIVKRKGRKEKFDERKVYGSVYAACYVSHMEEKRCEKAASAVSKGVKKWAAKKKLVASDEIFRVVVKELKKHSKAAAFMYETHRDVS